MKTAQDKINAAIQYAAAEGFDVGPVTFTPAAGNGGNRFATVCIDWTVGPAWGKIKIEFKPNRPGETCGAWQRAEGVAMVPAGFPMLPALAAALAALAAEACISADQNLPAGIAPATAV
jgi:hypothetical protein